MTNISWKINNNYYFFNSFLFLFVYLRKIYYICNVIKNNKLMSKEAKALGKEYEDKGYEVNLNLSEF